MNQRSHDLAKALSDIVKKSRTKVIECPCCWTRFTPSRWNESGCCSRSCATRMTLGKLNAADVEEMRAEFARGTRQSELVKAYGISRTTVSKLVKA